MLIFLRNCACLCLFVLKFYVYGIPASILEAFLSRFEKIREDEGIEEGVRERGGKEEEEKECYANLPLHVFTVFHVVPNFCLRLGERKRRFVPDYSLHILSRKRRSGDGR